MTLCINERDYYFLCEQIPNGACVVLDKSKDRAALESKLKELNNNPFSLGSFVIMEGQHFQL